MPNSTHSPAVRSQSCDNRAVPSQATTWAPATGGLPRKTTWRWEQLQMAPRHGQATAFLLDPDLVCEGMMRPQVWSCLL